MYSAEEWVTICIAQTNHSIWAHIAAQRQPKGQVFPCQDSSSRQLTIQAQPNCEKKNDHRLADVDFIQVLIHPNGYKLAAPTCFHILVSYI